MKKHIVLPVILFSMLLQTGCGSDNTPEAVTKGFFNALMAKDIEKAKTFLTKMSKDMAKIGVMQVNPEDSFTVGKVTLKGDNATVVIKLKEGTKTMDCPIQLTKEDDNWKIDLISTVILMNMK